MREILFRAKRKDNGEWIYGDLIQVPTKNSYSIIEHTPCAGVVEVIPETIGQYHNLNDNCDTKIFEDDIILCNYKNSFNEDGTKDVLVIKRGFDGFLQGEYLIGLGRYDLKKVIGNIHDNPELLSDKRYNDITIEAEEEEVVEVKHGVWMRSTYANNFFRCSECDAVWNRKFSYCPSCGAKMDKE